MDMRLAIEICSLIFMGISISSVKTDPLAAQKRVSRYLVVNHTACVIDGVYYESGNLVPSNKECETCICRPPGFSCTWKQCEHKPGCKAVRAVKDCCPEYHCGCEYKGVFYGNGELVPNGDSPCYQCRCQGNSIVCSLVDCFYRSDCAPVYYPGECCPQYTHCTPPQTSFLSEPTVKYHQSESDENTERTQTNDDESMVTQEGTEKQTTVSFFSDDNGPTRALLESAENDEQRDQEKGNEKVTAPYFTSTINELTKRQDVTEVSTPSTIISTKNELSERRVTKKSTTVTPENEQTPNQILSKESTIFLPVSNESEVTKIEEANGFYIGYSKKKLSQTTTKEPATYFTFTISSSSAENQQTERGDTTIKPTFFSASIKDELTERQDIIQRISTISSSSAENQQTERGDTTTKPTFFSASINDELTERQDAMQRISTISSSSAENQQTERGDTTIKPTSFSASIEDELTERQDVIQRTSTISSSSTENQQTEKDETTRLIISSTFTQDESTEKQYTERGETIQEPTVFPSASTEVEIINNHEVKGRLSTIPSISTEDKKTYDETTTKPIISSEFSENELTNGQDVMEKTSKDVETTTEINKDEGHVISIIATSTDNDSIDLKETTTVTLPSIMIDLGTTEYNTVSTHEIECEVGERQGNTEVPTAAYSISNISAKNNVTEKQATTEILSTVHSFSTLLEMAENEKDEKQTKTYGDPKGPPTVNSETIKYVPAMASTISTDIELAEKQGNAQNSTSFSSASTEYKLRDRKATAEILSTVISTYTTDDLKNVYNTTEGTTTGPSSSS